MHTIILKHVVLQSFKLRFSNNEHFLVLTCLLVSLKQFLLKITYSNLKQRFSIFIYLKMKCIRIMAKLNFSSPSLDLSEIILICKFCAQEIFQSLSIENSSVTSKLTSIAYLLNLTEPLKSYVDLTHQLSDFLVDGFIDVNMMKFVISAQLYCN